MVGRRRPATIPAPATSSMFTTAVRPGFDDASSNWNSRRFALRYSSNVPWKSRWSRVRFVKIATSKSIPSTRQSASACDDTSIATPRTPFSRMRASIASSSIASGVVCPAVIASSPIRYWIVPITPVSPPRARNNASTRYDVVVLPFVPVIPTTASDRDGCP